MSGWEWFVLITVAAAIAWAILIVWAHHRVTGHLDAADRYLVRTELCEHGGHDSCTKDWCDCQCHRVVVS